MLKTCQDGAHSSDIPENDMLQNGLFDRSRINWSLSVSADYEKQGFHLPFSFNVSQHNPVIRGSR